MPPAVNAVRLFAPAKVNLCLMVGRPRPDGLHPVVTLMQPLDLGDWLVVGRGGEGLRLGSSDPTLAGEDNLVLRAARAWFAAAGLPPAAYFHLDKRIPVAAGLGGGSSDAAAALLGLNVLHGGRLSAERLQVLAAGLGADVPFFLGGVGALCTGIGDKVSPRPDLPPLAYVLVNPGVAVSTAWAYRQFDLAWTNVNPDNRINDLAQDAPGWSGLLANDLEPVVMAAHPIIGAIKDALRAAGARGALMSGSGPTVFGIFGNRREAETAARLLARDQGWWVKACHGLDPENFGGLVRGDDDGGDRGQGVSG